MTPDTGDLVACDIGDLVMCASPGVPEPIIAIITRQLPIPAHHFMITIVQPANLTGTEIAVNKHEVTVMIKRYTLLELRDV
jgi:hypothetical protein